MEPLQAGLRGGVVQGGLELAVIAHLFHAPTEGVGHGGQLPAAGVLRSHLGEAGHMGLIGDDLGVGLDFVPGRGRLVGIETGLREQGPVVREGHAVRLIGHGPDLALVVLAVGEDALVELVDVRQGTDTRVDIDDLMLRDQALAIGERNGEDIRQSAGGQSRGEGRSSPVVLLGLDGDPRVLGFELGDLEVEGVRCFLSRAGAEHADRNGHGLVGRRSGCGARAGNGRADTGSGRDGGIGRGAGAHGGDGQCDRRQRLEPARRLDCHFLTHLDVRPSPACPAEPRVPLWRARSWGVTPSSFSSLCQAPEGAVTGWE